jgi:hypothetical protein
MRLTPSAAGMSDSRSCRTSAQYDPHARHDSPFIARGLLHYLDPYIVYPIDNLRTHPYTRGWCGGLKCQHGPRKERPKPECGVESATCISALSLHPQERGAGGAIGTEHPGVHCQISREPYGGHRPHARNRAPTRACPERSEGRPYVPWPECHAEPAAGQFCVSAPPPGPGGWRDRPWEEGSERSRNVP